MSERTQSLLDKLTREAMGVTPMQKHIILLKLTKLLEVVPRFENRPIEPTSPERKWLSEVGALLTKLDRAHYGSLVSTRLSFLKISPKPNADDIVGCAYDALEAIKLDLELDGRSEIGTAYEPGDIYKYYADLKDVINGAASEIMVVDAYFNGEAFNAYFGSVTNGIAIRLLLDRYADDTKAYADKHNAQYQASIEVRASKELHDRVIFVDQTDCWITGGSIKDAGKKAAYLIPVGPELAQAKLSIYETIWNRSTPK